MQLDKQVDNPVCYALGLLSNLPRNGKIELLTRNAVKEEFYIGIDGKSVPVEVSSLKLYRIISNSGYSLTHPRIVGVIYGKELGANVTLTIEDCYGVRKKQKISKTHCVIDIVPNKYSIQPSEKINFRNKNDLDKNIVKVKKHRVFKE